MSELLHTRPRDLSTRFSRVRLVARRERGLHRNRVGLGVYTEGGCDGSTYGERGRDMSREITVVTPWGDVRLILCWKDRR